MSVHWLNKVAILMTRQEKKPSSLTFLQYEGEQDLPMVMHLIDNELSEPYSIFTYR